MFIVRLRVQNTLKIPYIFSICEVPEVLKLGKKNGQNQEFFTPQNSLCDMSKMNSQRQYFYLMQVGHSSQFFSEPTFGGPYGLF